MKTNSRQLIAGNWKMNGLVDSLSGFQTLVATLDKEEPPANVLLCPPVSLLATFASAGRGKVHLGGQDCHDAAKGAFTGDISAEMLKNAGATFVIIGHSERRQYHHEGNDLIAAKLKAAWRAGLHPILCIGETLAQREAGETLRVLSGQLDSVLDDKIAKDDLTIAYEPVWAIGTGKTPTNEEIEQTHSFIRTCLTKISAELASKPVLYGGSVNPQNARGILALPHVGGALVGGASLKTVEFLEIIRSANVQ